MLGPKHGPDAGIRVKFERIRSPGFYIPLFKRMLLKCTPRSRFWFQLFKAVGSAVKLWFGGNRGVRRATATAATLVTGEFRFPSAQVRGGLRFCAGNSFKSRALPLGRYLASVGHDK